MKAAWGQILLHIWDTSETHNRCAIQADREKLTLTALYHTG